MSKIISKQRLTERDITEVSDYPSLSGCCGLFDMCSDQDLMSLSFEGTNKFLDWIGWEKTNICLIKKTFITWARPEASLYGRSSGHIEDPCGDSNGVDWGMCDFTLEDFGRLRRHGPVRDATKNEVRMCEMQPRYRLDGTPITNDAEYDMRLATEGLMQDLKEDIVTGTVLVAGGFDGLERLVKTGYTDSQGQYCTSMDSVVIDWNENDMDGGSGITWNGAAVSDDFNFVSVLLAAFRRVMDRIALAPALASQALGVGDMVFVAPTATLRCLLDAYTCWSVCPSEGDPWVMLQSYEARNFRQQLNGGLFGAGRIFLDGFEIPLVSYDWGLRQGATTTDAYLLTGRVGNIRTISGQYLDLAGALRGYPEANYSVTDGGRLLTWVNREQTCVQREVEMQPRLLMWAPWAQVRFQDVACVQPGPVLSPDPWSDYFPESSFNTPECIENAPEEQFTARIAGKAKR